MRHSVHHMVRFAHPQFLPRLKSRVSLRRIYEEIEAITGPK